MKVGEKYVFLVKILKYQRFCVYNGYSCAPYLQGCEGILRGVQENKPHGSKKALNVHQKCCKYSEAVESFPVLESLSLSITGTAIFVPPASNKDFTLSLQSAFMQRSVEASNYEAEMHGGWGGVLCPTAAHLIIHC